MQRIEQGDHVVEYIEANAADIAVARQLLDHVGGIGVDDLPPATRQLLVQLDVFVTELARKKGETRPEIRFTRRQVREGLGVGDTASKIHLARLVDAEFLLAHRAPHGRGIIYSMAFNGSANDNYDDERSNHGHPMGTPKSAQGQGEVGSRSWPATPPRKADNGKRGVAASRKRSIGASQKRRVVGSSRSKKRGRR